MTTLFGKLVLCPHVGVYDLVVHNEHSLTPLTTIETMKVVQLSGYISIVFAYLTIHFKTVEHDFWNLEYYGMCGFANKRLLLNGKQHFFPSMVVIPVLLQWHLLFLKGQSLVHTKPKNFVNLITLMMTPHFSILINKLNKYVNLHLTNPANCLNAIFFLKNWVTDFMIS